MIIQRLRTQLFRIKRVFTFAEACFGAKSRKKTDLAFGTRLLYYFRGIRPETWYKYNLSENNWKYYLTDIEIFRIPHQLRGRRLYSEFFKNKLLFSHVAGAVVNVPPVYGIIVDGKLRGLGEEARLRSATDVFALCRREGTLILKPYDGGAGVGVFQLAASNDSILLNGKPVTEAEFDAWMQQRSRYMLMKMAVQAKYAADIYPDTPNTIRFLTVIDPDSGKPILISAGHKIGTKRSYPVDSVQHGGVAVDINIETGVMDAAVDLVPVRYDKLPLDTMDNHPESGAPIKGVQIPFWKESVEAILNLAEHFSFLEIVGWDTMITEHGLVVIEANFDPGYKLTQMKTPMLADERLYRFFRHHGIVRRKLSHG